MTKEFEIVLNVPMECNACVASVSEALKSSNKLAGFDIKLSENIVVTKGSLPPSELVKLIQSTGRDAVIRGTGKPNSAGVCILESFDEKDIKTPVKGLARIVNVSDKDLFIDLTVNGLPKGTYYPSIRRSGNLTAGAMSTGESIYDLAPIDVTTKADAGTTINSIGAFVHASGDLFAGQAFLHADLNVKNLIGKSVVLSKLRDQVTPDSLVGIIARSAGAWENDKQVCSCSGKTVWEERKDALAKGLRT